MKDQTLDYMGRVVQGMINLTQMVRDDTAEAVATGDHIVVIKHYDAIRHATEKIKEARKALDEIEEQLSREHVPTVMRAHEIKTVTIEGVGRISISHRYSCSITDKVKGYQWLRDNNHGALITETVNSSTLSGFARQYMESEGKELPADEGFKVSTMAFTSITKVK